MIHLRLLGGIDLSADNGQEFHKVLAQPKRLALLAYLAADLEQQFHSRDRLLGLFWPELATERARAALSQALYFLRQELAEDLLISRSKDEIGIARDVIDCDAVAFMQAQREHNHQRMLDLYRGDLLAGLFLVESSEWQDWLLASRAQFRSAAAEAAWSLAQQAKVEGATDEAVRLGLRALELSDQDERYFRRLLTLLDELGDRAGAARHFRAFEVRIERELGIEVSPETRGIYEQIMARAPDPNASADMAGTGLTDKGESRSAPGDSAEEATEKAPSKLTIPAWQGAALVCAILVLLAAYQWMLPERITGPKSTPPENTLVQLTIMPFKDEGADPGGVYLAPALREELTSRLSMLPRLQVWAPEGEESLRIGVGLASSENSVQSGSYLLRGRIVPGGSGLKVMLALGESGPDEGAWREAVDIGVEDLLTAAASAAEWTASMVLPDLTASEIQKLRHGVASNATAYDNYLRGRYQLMIGSSQAFESARAFFEEALAIDPSFARAWSGLADAFEGLAWTNSLPDSVAVPRARKAAERSLELDPGLAEGHASLAQILNVHFWDSSGAESHFREAIRLQPNNADTHLRYSALLRNLGHLERARQEAETALKLDPITFQSSFQLIILDLMEQKHEAAILRASQLVELNPDVPMARFFLARCFIGSGDFDQALETLDLMGPGGNRPPALALRGYAMARTGRIEQAEGVLQALRNSAERAPDMPVHFDLAVVYLGLGKHELALDLLENAAEHRDFRVRLLGQEPMFRELHGKPRFTALLQRAGLQPNPVAKQDQPL